MSFCRPHPTHRPCVCHPSSRRQLILWGFACLKKTVPLASVYSTRFWVWMSNYKHAGLSMNEPSVFNLRWHFWTWCQVSQALKTTAWGKLNFLFHQVSRNSDFISTLLSAYLCPTLFQIMRIYSFTLLLYVKERACREQSCHYWEKLVIQNHRRPTSCLY